MEGQDQDITINLPIRTVSEMNTFEHWRIKHKRHKNQKIQTHLALKNIPIQKPCTITLTRLSSGHLDVDNLPPAMKYIKDAIAECINPNLPPGKADDDPLITWEFKQEKVKRKELGIKINIKQHASTREQK